MAEVKRQYDASGRREQARRRRRDVVIAARELFESDGFQATTIAAVARRAGVSAESIYKGFGTKAALAKAVFDFVIAGDDEPVAMIDRPETRAVQAEPDVRRKLRLYAAGVAERAARSARVQIMIRDGRHGDETLRATWQTLLDERLTGMTMFARHLLETGQLRAEITEAEIADVLWTYISVEIYELLVLLRDWSPERYAEFVGSGLITALCDPSV
ncbi:TetR/AcrR family transcriptional regulator [Kribbella sandramycini]|uniref:AcrR family transcriptional regulator n=1 Tax=Kribbella sandramycini TaxID=60450 RepID=A0A7Y4L0H3_9ACTN|nr:TetR/AcrR family transcriptional regulator [Kribbella sandramycini]MBB6565789.1 AcrR family transcriptional regulator [Kribbella sandramycini]NOL42053.1 TetR/AcrR family transcriptional regulator [Kribbella sandramycini]